MYFYSSSSWFRTDTCWIDREGKRNNKNSQYYCNKGVNESKFCRVEWLFERVSHHTPHLPLQWYNDLIKGLSGLAETVCS